MAKPLPPRPSLTHLRHEAKAILKCHRQGCADACPVLRHLRRFSGKSDHETLTFNVVLAEVQYALALEYGFESWKHLKTHVIGRETTMDAQYVGTTVRFRTAEPAPQQFDAWTFFWRGPRLESFDADLQYVVLLPDGTEHHVYDDLVVEAGGHVRSDFAEEFSGGDPRPLHGQPITIEFRASEGRMKFSRTGEYSFAFYERTAEGTIDWQQPFAKVDAVVV